MTFFLYKKTGKKGPAENAPEASDSEEKEPFSLNDISLRVPHGSLVMVCGGVGAGSKIFHFLSKDISAMF